MNFQICPQCKGHLENCQTCQGFGQVLDINGHLFSWQLKLSRQFIASVQFWHLIRKFIDIIIYLLGLAGIILSGLIIYQNYQSANSLFKFISRPGPAATVFWLTVLVCLYIFYKLSSWQPAEKKINYRPLKQTPKNVQKKVKTLQNILTLKRIK